MADAAFTYWSQYPASTPHSVDGGNTRTLCGRAVNFRTWHRLSRPGWGDLCKRCSSSETNIIVALRKQEGGE